ncbi:hypothetical protein DV735_g4981, partial [Chaetothyriales sp. CBS 134920]
MSPSSTSSSSTTPRAKIPLPVSLTSTSTTPPSLPSESQQALIQHLQESGSIGDLSSLLRDSLARSGWTDRVKALALELLRNGSCATFPELMTEVMRSQSNGTAASQTSSQQQSSQQQQNGGMNGAGSIVVAKEWTGGPDGLPDVRVPNGVVEVGVEFLEDKIKDVCYRVDDDGEPVS